jgi:hypothetical protein
MIAGWRRFEAPTQKSFDEFKKDLTVLAAISQLERELIVAKVLRLG